jgi:hypothetical protein
MKITLRPLGVLTTLALAAAVLHTQAQTFVGTNAPGTGSNFTFTNGPAVTNLSLVISNHASSYSYLLLARARTPSDVDFDFVSRLAGATNRIVLQAPEFVATNYGLRVLTPAASAQHAFTVTLTTNRTDLRTAPYPVLKPLVFTTPGTVTNATGAEGWNYFQVDVPTNLPGWRIVLSTTNANADLLVRKSLLPTAGSYDKRSLDQPVDTVIFNGTEATAGTYFIGVRLPSGPATNSIYKLTAELGWLKELAWDPGTADLGTQVYTNLSQSGGDYFFHISTLSTANGAWRSALRVTSGEADLYLRHGSAAQTNSYNHASLRVGSDGFVLAQANQFSPGQDWYLTVHASPGAQWTLLTGEAYVQALPNLAADASSSGSGTIGPEGMRFFKTTMSAGTLGWRLWLNGLANQMLVHDTKAPLPIGSAGGGYYDWTSNGQLLLVPPYIVTGSQYFVGISGNPGLVVNLDSRQQAIYDLAFNSLTNFTVTGYGYRTYRVQVPVQQIAWQINLTPTSGDANVAVRRDNVPNEFRSDAFSELAGSAGDSVTLVPAPPSSPSTAPGLTDGTFYITVYGSTPYTCSMTNGQPIITDVNYVFSITNDAPTRAGWRFYRVPDTAQQLGTYGWNLWLSNQVVGTEIALRRNAVPGRWNYRTCNANCTASSTTGYVDYSGTQGFLQRPGHQADIWYIGIYQPAAPLGPFILTGQELTATPLAFDPGTGSTSTVVNQPPLKWQYYIVTVPTNTFGWDLRLTNILSGDPRLVVCRDRLPYDLATHNYEGGYWYAYTSTTWPSGYSWAPDYDWANYTYDASGASVYGKLLQMGMGNPLQPGTYYVGVRAPDGATTPISYTLVSRGIGTNFAIPILPVAYAGGTAGTNALPVREVAYYRVDVPANSPSWKVRLTVTNEAMVAIQLGALPNIVCGGSAATTLAGGRKLQKAGNEEYLLLPRSGQTNVDAGAYYLAVVSEGQNPGSSRYGSNTCGFGLSSLGRAPTNQLGTLDITGATTLIQADTLRGGEMKFYQFSVPPGALALELTLTDQVGNPRLGLRADGHLPYAPPSYGRDNGQSYTWQNDNIITLATPDATNYTIAVHADAVSSVYVDAGYTIRVRALTSTPLTFDGGSLNIVNHTNGFWRFFQVTVPANALGWDLRLTNAVGDPRLVVCRDLAPNSLGTATYNGGYWYWYQATAWPSSNMIVADYDWTGWYYESSGSNSFGRVMQMGMGNPLEPGNYYIGVLNGSGNFGVPMSYSLVSRGIGTNHSIRVVDLPFVGTVASNGLPARQVAYYRVQVPAGAGSWKLRLEPTVGEAMLMLQRNFLPNTVAGSSSPTAVAGGRALQKAGLEHHTQMPRTTELFVTNGTYYVAVASEGQNPGSSRIGSNACNYVLQSFGPANTNQLGTVDPSGLTDIVLNDSVEGGDLKFYQFSVPPGTLNLEVRLENRVGNPHMTLRTGGTLIRGVDGYGQSDGQSQTWNDDALINLVSPTVTNYTLTVQGRSLSSAYPNASYTIRLHAMGLAPLTFNNGTASVAGQAVGTWRYFSVTVPPSAQGWDLRLTNVTSGDPRMVIRRDTLPDNLSVHTDTGGYWYWYQHATWLSGWQVAPDYDWTGWYYDNNGSNSYGRVFQTGMGNPLSPGNYIIGVIQGSGTAPLSYTVHSRGIGAGFTIPVGTAPFLGSITNNNLPARQASYYRLEVPAGQPNWKLRLSSHVGESMLMLQRSNLPNIAASSASPATLAGGRALQKSGNEHYLLLPESGQTTIPGGTYYVAFASEGQNPGASSRIGSNTCSSVLSSYGPLADVALGSVGGADLTHSNSLEAGEIRLYNFNVPNGTQAIECRLDNSVGLAYMTLRQGTGAATPYYSYGRNGGQGYSWAHARIITLPNVAPGVYSLTLHAESSTAASHTLRVRHLTPTNLAFDATLSGPGLTNVVSGTLADLQKQFFAVTVPALFQGQPVLGWKLDLDHASGSPRLRVRKDSLPNDSTSGNTPYATSQATLVPPYLTPGTWYVEVQGQGASAFTLRSSAIRAERVAWQMPQVGGTVTTPGLPPAGPLFGDTGVSVTGTNLPGDQGVDLEQGRMHYYAITIPSNNVGIIRTRLDAISGNPDLYLRDGHLPSLTHSTSGDTGNSCYDRYLTANTGSEYGNWVPLNGRYDLQLPPGTWYLGVLASGNSNVRYRLRCYTGIITPLAYDGVNLINQSLAAGDWRYYQVNLPTNCPTSWNATFAQTLGDVVMYVRDTTPPGHGAHVTDYRDWSDDNKNHGPYARVDPPGTTNLPCPPLRPGRRYYLGFRAVNDATFSVSSTTNAVPINYTNVVPFYAGYYSNNIAPNGVLKLRVDVPPDGRRLTLTTTCSNTVTTSLSQGSVPRLDGRHASWNGSSTFSQALYTGTWPWAPGYMYFLLVTNNTALTQSFTLNADGQNAATDDFDGDGLPDAWELACWGSIYSYNGNSDPDGDGVNNQEEYLEGTVPCNAASFRPRLLTTAIGGVVTLNPVGSATLTPPRVSYPLGQNVTLTPSPDPGYSFLGWSGDASGAVNPLVVNMNAHKNIAALFGITNHSGADYQFQMSLTSSVPAPPALQNIGAGNTYVSTIVDACPRTVLRFPQGNGLLLQPTSGVVPTNVYTIVMLFRFDSVANWKRVLDFKAGATDNGLYLLNGALYLYPSASGPAGAVLASNWVQVVVTRDATKTVVGYVNGVQQFSFTDTSDHAVLSSANALRFFKDNNNINEEGAGEVARIRLYAAPMTPGQVTLLDRTDCLGVPQFLTPWFNASWILNLPVTNVTPGVPYRLLASTNLANWTGIATNTPLANPWTFTDPRATNHPNRFYRLATP